MKALLIRLSSLGDCVLATAAVEALARARPDAEIHVLTKPAFLPLFAPNPHVARALAWEPVRSPAEMARQLAPERYDWAADLHANLRTRALRLFLRGPRWTVYRKGALRRRLATALHRPGWLAADHVIDRYVAALSPLGVSPGRVLPRLYPMEGERGSARELLIAGGWDGRAPVTALAPGARWATKAWPAGKWAELAKLVAAAGEFPLWIGGKEEAQLCRDLRAVSGVAGATAAGAAPVGVTAALIEGARALVTNDSAPLHIACAVSTPAVALFGPTVRGFGFFPVGPRDRVVEEDGLSCRPCSLHGSDRCPRGDLACLAGIGPERVAAELRAIPKREGAGP